LPWYTFTPVVGYVLYLPQVRMDFPNVRQAKLLLIVLENTLVYFLIGVAAGLVHIPYSVWFSAIPMIVAASTFAEFWAIRRWGERFRVFGWDNIRRFGDRRFTLSALYVGVQAFSFLTLGYMASRSLRG